MHLIKKYIKEKIGYADLYVIGDADREQLAVIGVNAQGVVAKGPVFGIDQTITIAFDKVKSVEAYKEGGPQ